MGRTAAVILNWNTQDFLRRFLPPLIESLPEHAEAIVADNGSTDSSADVVRTEFPGTELIAFDRNYGFTGGYDRAFDALKGRFDYYLLMNTDIEVAPGWFEPLEAWMESHPECGVCGPKLHSWHDRDCFEYAGAAGGLIDRYGYPFCRGRVMGRLERDCGQYDDPGPLMWVSGACMMVRAELWHRLGGLDDRFFAHMEEIDFCWRAQLAGYRVNVVPESVVWHIGGGTLPNKSPRKLFLNYRNNILLLENNLEDTIALGMPRRRAAVKARLRIGARKCLDLLSALVYLLEGKAGYFRAVLQGHREARKLAGRRMTPVVADRNAKVYGIFNGSMVLCGLLGIGRFRTYSKR